MLLKKKLYVLVRMKSAPASTINPKFICNAIANPPIKSNAAQRDATPIESLPEGIGRFFFFSWFLSESASTMSFMVYEELEIRQSEMNANVVVMRAAGLST